MAKFSINSLALKWYFFTCLSGGNLYGEYFNLFMKQLGFNPGQIGFTTLLGVPHLFIPLCLLFGEKFRARKTVVVFGTAGVFVSCMLPLLSLIVPALQPTCYPTTLTPIQDIQQATLHVNGSVHSRYANKTNKLSTSEIHNTPPYLTSTKNIPLAPILKNRSVFFHNNRTNQSRSNIYRTMPSFALKNSSSVQQLLLSNSSVYSKYSQDERHRTAYELYKSSAGLRLNNSLSLDQSRLSNGLIQSSHSNNVKHPSAFKIHNLLAYLTTNGSLQHFIFRRSSTPSNYSNSSSHPSYTIHHPQAFLSALFLLLTLSRSLTVYFERIDLALANLATITYLKEEQASYGSYYMWSNIGCALSISSVAVLAWWIRVYICEVEKYGYFIAFIWAGVMSLLSMLSLPWFKFEYNEKKNFNWSSVKSDVFNAHYVFMFVVLFYTGLCLSFQCYWELWYLDGLSASPLLIGGAALIRRPLLAVFMFSSSHLIRKIGDLKTVCVALFLYSLAFLALSFTRIAWLVLIIDTCQAAAFGFSYCAFTVLFCKAASKENSSMILGLQETVFAVGFEGGSTLMGTLFHALETRLALLIYSLSSAVVLVILLLYIHFSKHVYDYERLTPEDSDME